MVRPAGNIAVFRDVADYKALLSKNQISPNTNSALTTQWNSAIDSFIDGDYQAALDGFKAVQDKYPAFYLATSLITQAEARVDEANRALAFKVGIGVMLVVLAGGVFMAWRTFGHVKLHRQQQYATTPQAPYPPTYYAAPGTAQPQSPQPQPAQPQTWPQLPQQQPVYSQPPPAQPVQQVQTPIPTQPPPQTMAQPVPQQPQAYQYPVVPPPSNNVIAPTTVEAPNQQQIAQPVDDEDNAPRIVVG